MLSNLTSTHASVFLKYYHVVSFCRFHRNCDCCLCVGCNCSCYNIHRVLYYVQTVILHLISPLFHIGMPNASIRFNMDTIRTWLFSLEQLLSLKRFFFLFVETQLNHTNFFFIFPDILVNLKIIIV